MLPKKTVKKVNPDKFVRYDEGAQMYHMGLHNAFIRWKECKDGGKEE